jgi:hypothetical protein
MTSEPWNFVIETDDPLAENALTKDQKEVLGEHLELVRQVCVAEYSSSPLWQARAAKDPDYWSTFSVGRFNLPPEMAHLTPFSQEQDKKAEK